MAAKFELGGVYSTPGAMEAMESAGADLLILLNRYSSGDWGDVSPADAKLNDQALIDRTRLLSAYRIAEVVKVWIITEWDRSVTTLLLPDEY